MSGRNGTTDGPPWQELAARAGAIEPGEPIPISGECSAGVRGHSWLGPGKLADHFPEPETGAFFAGGDGGPNEVHFRSGRLRSRNTPTERTPA